MDRLYNNYIIMKMSRLCQCNLKTWIAKQAYDNLNPEGDLPCKVRCLQCISSIQTEVITAAASVSSGFAIFIWDLLYFLPLLLFFHRLGGKEGHQSSTQNSGYFDSNSIQILKRYGQMQLEQLKGEKEIFKAMPPQNQWQS